MRGKRIQGIRHALNSSRFCRMPCRRHWVMFIIHIFERIIIKRCLLVFELDTGCRNSKKTDAIKRINTPYQDIHYYKECTKVSTHYKRNASYKTCEPCCKEPVVSLRLNILIKLFRCNLMLRQKLLFLYRCRFNKARELIKTNSYNNIDSKKSVDIASPSNTTKERNNKSKQTDKEALLKNIHLNLGFHHLTPSQLILTNQKGKWK